MKTTEYWKLHVGKRRWRKLVAVLGCIVVFCTTYALILPAITMTQETFCGKEEHQHTEKCYREVLICGEDQNQTAMEEFAQDQRSEQDQGQMQREYVQDQNSASASESDISGNEDSILTEDVSSNENGSEEADVSQNGTENGHIHTQSCYELRLICEKEEHQHSLACYSDPQADLENASVWERTLPQELSGNPAQDLAAIANSQLGYTASTKNYQVDENGNLFGYTRYGACFDNPYGEWNGLFVSFCLRYAGVTQDAFPYMDEAHGVHYTQNAAAWMGLLDDLGLYQKVQDGQPKTGDIVFLDQDLDGTADHVGIVTEGASQDTSQGDLSLSDVGVSDGDTGMSENDTAASSCSTAVICIVEGNIGGSVTANTYETDAPMILGYGIVPEEIAEDGIVQEFAYEDQQISMVLYVESPKPLPEETELISRALPQDSDNYQAITEYARELDAGAAGTLILKEFSLAKDGENLELPGLRMTAEVTVKAEVIEPLAEQLTQLEEAAPEAELGIELAVLLADEENSVSQVESTLVAPEETAPVLNVELQNGILALRAAATANPKYSVQYYAYIPRFAKSGNGELKLNVIDTSGAKLPTNSGTLETTGMYLEATGRNTAQNRGDATELYRVATELILTQMYATEENLEYIKSPNTSYVNKLIDNPNYILKEIWILKGGKDSASIDPADWNIYPADSHFTNREGGNAHQIVITDGTVLRLVYDCSEGNYENPATFYDYDITSGQNNDGRWRSGITGINVEGNYGTSANGNTNWKSYRDILAFGNANCGTGMANYKFNGVYLNKHSGNNSGCTFGLVKGLSNGQLVYNDWIVAPKLFNEGSANGKHTYDNSSLTFSRTGDSYTLSSAEVSGVGSIGGLQEFFHPSPTAKTVHGNIYTNNFWPMDKATNRTDPNFGEYGKGVLYQGFISRDGINGKWDAETGNFPVSDDGNAHNSFFGMQYAVSFDLTKDYTGPLEYYFFGDDDMWVFLDDKLVCDIGGVHSSVGEYVNLWDYLEKGQAGKHKLTFFYTERGASGSTCYMNFTLPSVSGINIERKTGDLKVRKEVIGESDPEKEEEEREFTFRIHFDDWSGEEIWDDYAYSKYNADGTLLENDLVLHEGSEFKLKNGQYVEIKYLPFGLRYTIEEINAEGYTVTNKVNGVIQAGEEATGTIIKDALNEVVFINTIGRVGFTLQKLDMEGNPLAGAVFCLKDSTGSEISFVKSEDGTYTVPSEDTQLLRDGELYYIALKADPEYVIEQKKESTYDALLQKKSDSNWQKVRAYRQADGSYSFRNEGSGMWLDLDAGKTENETLIHFYSNADMPTTHDNQKWYLQLTSDGAVKLKPRMAVQNGSKAVMDLDGGKIAEGGRIQVWESNDSNAQKWLFVPVNPTAAPEVTSELEVGADGIRLAGLMPGNYTLEEIQSPGDDFAVSSDPIQFHVDANGKVRLIKDGGDLVSVDDQGILLQVKNRYRDRSLTIQKAVKNSDTTQAFRFVITYEMDGKEVKQTLSLKNGEQGTVSIPYGVTVRIQEENHAGFAVAYSEKDDLLPLIQTGSTCTINQVTKDLTILAENTAGYALPKTGGTGTIWYTAGGLLLLAAALLLHIDTKYKRKEVK